MSIPLATDAHVPLPPMVQARHCNCPLHVRRRLGGALLGSGLLAAAPGLAFGQSPQPAAAPDAECRRSRTTKLMPAEQLEQAASQQYRSMLQQAAGQRALAGPNDAQLRRLTYIAQRIVPFAPACNPRAAQWRWEVNLIGSAEINAFCMPGGKIAFYMGILQKLSLSDDEVAMIMGHEAAHALLEHARERMAKTSLTRGAIEVGASLLGLGGASRMLADMGGQLLTLRFSRDDESEADALGLLVAARAGYNPASGVTLWQKMLAANKNAPPQFMSTHPSGETRIQDIQARLPRLTPVYTAAAKPDRRFAPPPRA